MSSLLFEKVKPRDRTSYRHVSNKPVSPLSCQSTLSLGREPWVLCRLDKHNVGHESLTNIHHRRMVTGFGGNDWAVNFGVKEEWQAKMEALTSVGKGEKKYLAIIFDGKVLAAPILNSVLSNSAQISGSYTEDEARALAAILKAGTLERAPVLVK